jgi:HTH-type transcriptional repressor of NAD biosynthesis genes
VTLAASPPPLAWYGSSFVYYDEPEPPGPGNLDGAAERARAERLAASSQVRLGHRPGGPADTGVVLGRFLPVHDGHRYLVEFARAHVAHVANLHIFVRLAPGDPVPWKVRLEWLTELFPGAKVAAVEDGPDGGVDEERWAEQIRSRVRPRYVFAGEDYGPRLAQRLDARFVRVDRQAIPVSGTQVRADPWACEQHLPPPVRAWYARRVCLIGPESTGKTTLAERLAAHYGTVWVPERLRTAGGDLRGADVSLVAHGQQATEDALARRASRVLICDTDLLSVRLWSERLFGATPDWLRKAADSPTADLHLLTAPDLPFVGPDERNEPAERREFHAACERELVRLGRPYVTIEGSPEQRFARAVAAVDDLLARPPR